MHRVVERDGLENSGGELNGGGKAAPSWCPNGTQIGLGRNATLRGYLHKTNRFNREPKCGDEEITADTAITAGLNLMLKPGG
jgi:hypothetical protein